MKTILSGKNQNLNLLSVNPIQRDHSTLFFYKKFQLETILGRLEKQDNELFGRIVEAVKTNDNFLSAMLASELVKLRILERNLRTIKLLECFKVKT